MMYHSSPIELSGPNIDPVSGWLTWTPGHTGICLSWPEGSIRWAGLGPSAKDAVPIEARHVTVLRRQSLMGISEHWTLGMFQSQLVVPAPPPIEPVDRPHQTAMLGLIKRSDSLNARLSTNPTLHGPNLTACAGLVWLRHICLAAPVEPPTGDGVIGAQTTGVDSTGRDLAELPYGRIRLAIVIGPPTGDAFIGA